MRKPKVNFNLRWLNIDLWGNLKFSKSIEKLSKKYIYPKPRS